MKYANRIGNLKNLTENTIGGVYELFPPLESDIAGNGSYQGVAVAVRTGEPGPSGRTTFVVALDVIPLGRPREWLEAGELSLPDTPVENLLAQAQDPALLFCGRDIVATTEAEALAALGYEVRS